MAEEIIGVKVKVDAGDVGKSVGSLKQQLREAQNEVTALSEKFGATSKEAINAAKKAAILKDSIGDAKALTDAFNPDQKFKALSSSLAGAAGGFAALQGAVGLFGNQAEAVEKTLLKVQSALALSQGLEAVGNSIDSFKVLGGVIKDSVSKAFGTLRSAIISTGIGALVIGVGLLIANFETVKKVVLNFIPGLGKLADFVGKLVNKVTDFVGITSEAGRATAKLIEDNDKAIKNSERFLELNGDKYDEYTQRKIKANLEFKKKQNEFQKDEQLTEEQKNAFILQARDKANREIAKSDTDRNNASIESSKKLSEQQKALAEKQEQERKKREEDAKKARDKELDRILAGRLDEENQIEIDNRRKDRIKDENSVFTKGYDEKLKLFGKEVEARNVIDAAAFKQKKAIEEQDKSNAEFKKKAMESELAMAQNTLSIIGGLVDQNSAAGKAIAVTQAIINTYQGASKAIAQGGIFGPVAAAATIAAGLINVKKIISTKIPSAKGTGSVADSGGGTMSMSAAPISPSAPIQNTVTSLSQQSINQMGSAAGRAYVVESDITNQQEKIIRINRAARLG